MLSIFAPKRGSGDAKTPQELRRLMPLNAQDAETARQFVALGPDKLMPVLPDMLRRLKDHLSPVSAIYCAFFVQHPESFAAQIGTVLARNQDAVLKHVIVTGIVIHWPHDTLAKIAGTMQNLVTHTDFFNTDLILIRLLHTHCLAERQWLSDWLKFKRDRLARLSEEAEQLETLLARPETPTTAVRSP